MLTGISHLPPKTLRPGTAAGGTTLTTEITYEVQVSNEGRWIATEVCMDRGEGVRVAESLLAAGKAEAVRVLEEREGRRPKVIFEKAGAARPEKPLTVVAIEDAAVCQTLADIFTFEARLTVARLMRQFLDEYGMTALELFYDFGRLRQIHRHEKLYPQALNRLATVQARKMGKKPAERIDFLNSAMTDLIERARNDKDVARFHAILKEQGTLAMAAAVDKEFKNDRAVYLKGGAVAKLLGEDADWNGKVSLLCSELERGAAGEALSFLDDALAEILDGGEAIRAIFGGQPDLGTALRNLTLLSYGACADKGGRNSCLTKLNAVLGRTRLSRSRQIIVGRVERALKGVGPLARDDPKANRDMFVGLLGQLMAPAGLLGGPGMSEAVTQRARIVLSDADQNLTPEEAIKRLQTLMPSRAVRLGYLLDLARSPFGQANPAVALKALALLLTELPDLASLFPAGSPPARQKAVIADLRRRLDGEEIPRELRDQLAKRLDRIRDAMQA